MKNIYRILLVALAVLTFSSCEKFFTREPINSFSAETYFANENQMKMYTDGMINSWMPSMDDIGYAGYSVYNDLIATRTSTTFFQPGLFDATRQGSWTWTWARRCNIMIERMEKNGKGNVDEETYNHYMGIARFWRGYYHFSRLKTFSNIPYIDKVVDSKDSTILFGTRLDREEAFHLLSEDLDFARANCQAGKFHTAGRVYINKYVILTYLSRIYLYEGTFRKYHTVNPATNTPWTNKYETADELIRKAADCAGELIKSGAFSLHGTYPDLFLSEELCQDEVIWGRSYSVGLGATHNLTRYFNSSTLGQQYSGTKELVRHYLKADGTPVLTGEQTINQEFNGRDARLAATVLGPGHNIAKLTGETSPQVINMTWNCTGYQLVKWCIPDETHQQNAIDGNSLPILRYAEVLLNYAEAKELLGEMDKGVWEQTIGALRKRAGVTSIYPGDAGYVKDQWLRDYYTTGVEHPSELSDVLLEIRRERVTEMTLEQGIRLDDLYRWNLGDLVVKRHNGEGWGGIWITEDEYKNGFTFEGTKYTFANGGSVGETKIPITAKADRNWTLEKAGNGYYLVYNYKLEWLERSYVRPIPLDDLNLNPNLGQNYGWD
ncbi:MAG: RagB/SusD family nutrient uptake outer membrane protein [Bacteroidales bacterium]|nr:RagB/SusD family nutrient uptake outer membrane protein [Bacteroidales bacterium]